MLSYFASLNPAALLRACPGGIAQGLIWGIMALGVYMTYRMLGLADLTVDGSLATGGAVCIMLVLAGWNPQLALLISFIAGVLAELIVPVCGGLREFLIPGPERPDDLGGPGRQAAHQLRVKEVPAGGVILDTAVLHSPVQKVFQNLFQGAVLRSVSLFPVVQLQSLQQAVGGPGAVTVLVPFTPAGRRPRGGSSPHGSFPGPKRPRSFP